MSAHKPCLRNTTSRAYTGRQPAALHVPRRAPIMHSNRCYREEWDHGGLSQLQLQERGISSLDEYIARRKDRIEQRDELLRFLASEGVTGQDKGWARCAYIFRNGRLPFQCQKCWMLPGHCVCNSLRRFKPRTKVVIHMHPDEWAKGSNTGCLCVEALSESGAVMLMKGHKQHDEQLQQLLADPSYTCAMLWPGDGALEPHQLLDVAQQRGTQIALIAIDATWDCARKMKSKYPPGVLMLKLPAHLVLPCTAGQHQQRQEQSKQPAVAAGPVAGAAAAAAYDQDAVTTDLASCCSSSCSVSAGHEVQSSNSNQQQPGQRVSLFRPLRKYKGNAAENGRVCTLEAVAGALLALEGDREMYNGLLHNLKLKVDAMRRQKHMAEVYGTGPDQ